MHRIIFIQYTNPAAYPPLEHSSHILAEDGWEILFLGTSSLGASELVFPAHVRIHERKLPFRAAGWRQKLHYLRYLVWCVYWTMKWKPRWIYASDPLSCPVAMILNLIPGLRVIYHEHDSPSFNNVSGFQKIVLLMRRLLSRRAERCVLPNRQRAEWFDSDMKTSHQSLVVWNCPTIDEVGLPREQSDNGDLWVLYHGSIVPVRLPKTVIQALASVSTKIKLKVIGYETIGHKGYVEELQDLARRYGVEHRVEFVAAVPRQKLLEISQSCDIGLALMPMQTDDINQQWMVGASNKAFDYLACGLALIVSDLPEWNDAYVESGFGISCNPDDSNSIAAKLNWFFEHRSEMRLMGERGRQNILSDWNYEKQFIKVVEMLNNDGF